MKFLKQWVGEIREETEKERESFINLIPEHGIPREERIVKNSIVREKLPELSNYVIIDMAVWGHDLSRRELIKRLKEHQLNLKELFLLLEYLFSGFYFVDQTQIIRRLMETTEDEIQRIAPLADRKEVEEIIEIFFEEEYVIEILQQIKETNKGNSDIFKIMTGKIK